MIKVDSGLSVFILSNEVKLIVLLLIKDNRLWIVSDSGRSVSVNQKSHVLICDAMTKVELT